MNPLFSRFFKNLVFQELFNTKNIFIQEWMINCNLLITLSFSFIFSNIKEESDSSSLSFKLSFSNYHLRFQLHQHFTRHPIHMHQRSSSFDFPITFSLQPKYTLQDILYTCIREIPPSISQLLSHFNLNTRYRTLYISEKFFTL